MYEDMQLLFAKPVLCLLIIALADGALEDYYILEKIDETPPPIDSSLYHLRFRKELHSVPFPDFVF